MLYRENYVQKIVGFKDMDVIKVITGLRRSGKSTIMRQVQEYYENTGISRDQILYYNFESYEYIDLLDDKKLYMHIKNEIQHIQGCCYLFLDEIQNVKNWQKCINALQVDVHCDIYITGSNAKLLSGELATYIAGRFIEIKVFPFSFKEYAAAQKDQNREKKSKVLFQEYLQYGGMPFVCYLNDKEKFKEYMSGVFSTIILNDMISRNNVRNPLIMERVLTYAIDNIGHLISASSIVKYLKNEHLKVSIDTVISYLRMGSDALLFQKTPRGNLLGKEVLKTQEKYYISDHGFKQYLFHSNMRDIELVLENIICIEMLRRGYDVSVGEVMKKEVDFVCRRNEECLYIQVSYLMPDSTTREREFAPLLLIRDNYPKYVLSMDELDFSQQGIRHCNIVDFLLADGY